MELRTLLAAPVPPAFEHCASYNVYLRAIFDNEFLKRAILQMVASDPKHTRIILEHEVRPACGNPNEYLDHQ